MRTLEVTRRIRQLELFTKRLMFNQRIGNSASKQKGTGFDFDQIREYQTGDDVRFIDWKSSARTNKLLLKQYMQESTRTVLIAVDCSRSMLYTSGNHTKYDTAAFCAGVLALAAHYAKDAVGLLLFGSTIHRYMPPANAHVQVMRMIDTLFSTTPDDGQTAFADAFEYLARQPLKNALVIMISDFIGIDDHRSLALCAARHDMVAVRTYDKYEQHFPSMGLIMTQDLESGSTLLLDARTIQKTARALGQHEDILTSLLRKHRIDALSLDASHQSLLPLIHFFRRRALAK